MNRLKDIRKITLGDVSKAGADHLLPSWCKNGDYVIREVASIEIQNDFEDLESTELWSGGDLIGFHEFVHPKGMNGIDGFKWFCGVVLTLSDACIKDLQWYEEERLYDVHMPSDYKNLDAVSEYKDKVNLWALYSCGRSFTSFDDVTQNHYAAHKIGNFIDGLCGVRRGDLTESKALHTWFMLVKNGNLDILSQKACTNHQ
ncbi:hypothetical protein VPDG_00146 [Vibrio phage henriette 12B8]|uniref:hypothetical protein n=1 Tax=Vibrio phage henriette 12B8 TaxID=573174 RepID=UPI0002C0EBC0|nr:hypothetical protein VPDG_00146 [Vibrio phage henriette 12B8]AGG58307.1 hypothetical protein VPDG_00146 [Vibrio phage henriette 12B8]